MPMTIASIAAAWSLLSTVSSTPINNRLWPPHRVSILAGFVEPGESAEQAVAREVREETGIAVRGIRYVGSQPWPMPQSLMLGFRAEAGHARHCPVDGSEHFPRIDPAVIMLVTDDEDRCLLAHNRMWPPRRVSILAGFVEAGESAEQAVAREVREETGVEVAEISYLGSQPWPMPQSLMLGFRAQAQPRQEIRVDGTEIAEARWFSRTELGEAAATGEVLLPPPVSIAHQIIRTWYGGPLPGTW